MDELDILRLRMRITKLDARREWCEIERDALTAEINSPVTSELARRTAAQRRDTIWAEWAEIVEELKSLLNADSIS